MFFEAHDDDDDDDDDQDDVNFIKTSSKELLI